MLRRNKTELAPREASPQSLFGDFDRIFEDFRLGLEDVFTAPFGALASWNGNAMRQPAIDLKDEGKEFVVTAELPGVTKDGLDLQVTEDGLELQAKMDAEQKKEDDGYVYRERSYSAWYRRLPFPAEVVPDGAQAALKDGVLTVRVPKKEPTPERKPRKIRVE